MSNKAIYDILNSDLKEPTLHLKKTFWDKNKKFISISNKKRTSLLMSGNISKVNLVKSSSTFQKQPNEQISNFIKTENTESNGNTQNSERIPKFERNESSSILKIGGNKNFRIKRCNIIKESLESIETKDTNSGNRKLMSFSFRTNDKRSNSSLKKSISNQNGTDELRKRIIQQSEFRKQNEEEEKEFENLFSSLNKLL